MPGAWPEVAFGDVFDISSSKRVLEKQWTTCGVPFYRAREIVKLSREGRVDNELFISEELYDELKDKSDVPTPGDLVVSAVGTLGACYVVQPGDRFYFKDASVLLFKPKRGVDSRFIWHAFQTGSIQEQIHAGSGSTVGTYTISRAKQTKLRLPPLAEQNRIAAILDKADALRAKRREAIAKLDQLLQSVFLDMFGDPVSNTKDWSVSTIGDECEVGSGSTPSRQVDAHFSGTIPWVKSTEVNWGVIRETGEHVSESGQKVARLRVYPAGTVVVALYGQGTTRGKCALLGVSATMNQACAGILPSSNIDRTYLFHYLRRSYERLRGESRGGNQENLNLGILKAFPLLVPSLDLQKRFARLCASYEAERAMLHKATEQMDRLFSSLQSRAFAGTL